MYKLVLIRHGESTWNLENRFTGWTDVPLTATGVAQAQGAGRLLKELGYDFDVAYTVTDDGELRQMVVTGAFYGGDDQVTYTVDFDQYGIEQEITAP